MSEDRRRPAQYASLRDEALRPWVSADVHPHSAPVRAALDAAGLGRNGVRTASDLARLPIVSLSDLGDGREHVLAPTARSIKADGDARLRFRLAFAELRGDRARAVRATVDIPFKPIVWTAAPTPTGVLHTSATTTDLERLAALGRRGLAISGVRAGDRVLATEGPGAGIGARQLLEGCRDGGVAVLHLDPDSDPSTVLDAAPTVVSGTPASLHRLLDTGLPPGVRLLIVHRWGSVTAADVAAVGSRVDLPVSSWWAPAGVRAAWVGCPGGTGVHTWPTDEVLEVVDDQGAADAEGRLIWSAVGWHGSVWLRVDLGHRGHLEVADCPTCGRTTPRIVVAAETPALAETAVRGVPAPDRITGLDDISGVADWLHVRRPSGDVVLVRPTSRSVVDAVKVAVGTRTGLRVTALAPSRFAAVRAAVGDVRRVEESQVADVLARAGR